MPPIVRRRQVIVQGFQARFVAIHMVWMAALLLAFAVLLIGPFVLELNSTNVVTRPETATSFLRLHTALWPLLLGLLACAAAVHIWMSHRVAGPLHQFRKAFAAVTAGKLTVRVRVRTNDFLVSEAAELDQMIEFLRTRIGRAQLGSGRASSQLSRIAGGGSPGSADISELTAAIAEIEDALSVFAATEDAGTGNPAAAAPATRPALRVVPPSDRQAGFSLVELLIGMAIVTILAAIGVPAYASALEAARVARATGDISAIDRDVNIYLVQNSCYPSGLADVGRDALRDPWGRPYQYGVIGRAGGGGRGGGGGGGGQGRGQQPPAGGQNGCGACAGACITQGQARKDRRLVPINSDFDLYSMGKDGLTAPALTALNSLDDVVRGSGGSYVGLARLY